MSFVASSPTSNASITGVAPLSELEACHLSFTDRVVEDTSQPLNDAREGFCSSVKLRLARLRLNTVVGGF